jgi:hypothetical protein
MNKLLLSMILLISSPLMAQTTTYSDSMGRVVGYGSTVGNQTTYSDSYGRVVGYESQNGISSTYSNSMGQVTGYGSTLGQPQPYTPYTPTQMPSFNPNVLIGR